MNRSIGQEREGKTESTCYRNFCNIRSKTFMLNKRKFKNRYGKGARERRSRMDIGHDEKGKECCNYVLRRLARKQLWSMT